MNLGPILLTKPRFPCPECNGTGETTCGLDLVMCDVCHGSGDDADSDEDEP